MRGSLPKIHGFEGQVPSFTQDESSSLWEIVNPVVDLFFLCMTLMDLNFAEISQMRQRKYRFAYLQDEYI